MHQILIFNAGESAGVVMFSEIVRKFFSFAVALSERETGCDRLYRCPCNDTAVSAGQTVRKKADLY